MNKYVVDDLWFEKKVILPSTINFVVKKTQVSRSFIIYIHISPQAPWGDQIWIQMRVVGGGGGEGVERTSFLHFCKER